MKPPLFANIRSSMLPAVLAIATLPLAGAELSISFDKDGQTTGTIPEINPGDNLRFRLSDPSMRLIYRFDYQVADGFAINCTDHKDFKDLITIDKTVAVGKDKNAKDATRYTAALYFNLIGKHVSKATQQDVVAAKKQLDTLKGLKDQRKQLQQAIDTLTQQISDKQEEIKAFTGTAVGEAVQVILAKQKEIAALRVTLRDSQKQLSDLKDSGDDEIADDQKKFDDLSADLNAGGKDELKRAGVLLIGPHRKASLYSISASGDASNPYRLKHFQPFPVLTTDDVPFVFIFGQRAGQQPTGLHAKAATSAGTYIDVDPVRPVVTQPSGASHPGFSCIDLPVSDNVTFVDRALTFTDHLSGETIYSITVSGYGLVTTSDTTTIDTGGAPSTDHKVVKNAQNINIVDSDALPQVHSLFRYNLSSGVIWSSLRSPSFPRIPTGTYLKGCDPNTSDTDCKPLYMNGHDSGGPRVLPVLMFTVYPFKRDTQVPVRWKEMLPAPSIGLSLSTPTDDFFLGGSSEIKGARNVQLVYGLHLGRVGKLSANSTQLPTESSSAPTAKSLQKGGFVGLTFNIDFVKGLFGK